MLGLWPCGESVYCIFRKDSQEVRAFPTLRRPFELGLTCCTVLFPHKYHRLKTSPPATRTVNNKLPPPAVNSIAAPWPRLQCSFYLVLILQKPDTGDVTSAQDTNQQNYLMPKATESEAPTVQSAKEKPKSKGQKRRDQLERAHQRILEERQDAAVASAATEIPWGSGKTRLSNNGQFYFNAVNLEPAEAAALDWITTLCEQNEVRD